MERYNQDDQADEVIDAIVDTPRRWLFVDGDCWWVTGGSYLNAEVYRRRHTFGPLPDWLDDIPAGEVAVQRDANGDVVKIADHKGRSWDVKIKQKR